MTTRTPRIIGVGVCRVCGNPDSLYKTHICATCWTAASTRREQSAMTDTVRATSIQQASVETTSALRLSDLRSLVERTNDWPPDSVVYPESKFGGQRDEYMISKITINHSQNVY